MERRLTHHLLILCERYSSAKGIGDATIGKQCAADGRFFARLRDGKTYTVRKYDEVLTWFSANWPRDVEWPDCVERPELEAAE